MRAAGRPRPGSLFLPPGLERRAGSPIGDPAQQSGRDARDTDYTGTPVRQLSLGWASSLLLIRKAHMIITQIRFLSVDREVAVEVRRDWVGYGGWWVKRWAHPTDPEPQRFFSFTMNDGDEDPEPGTKRAAEYVAYLCKDVNVLKYWDAMLRAVGREPVVSYGRPSQ